MLMSRANSLRILSSRTDTHVWKSWQLLRIWFWLQFCVFLTYWMTVTIGSRAWSYIRMQRLSIIQSSTMILTKNTETIMGMSTPILFHPPKDSTLNQSKTMQTMATQDTATVTTNQWPSSHSKGFFSSYPTSSYLSKLSTQSLTWESTGSSLKPNAAQLNSLFASQSNSTVWLKRWTQNSLDKNPSITTQRSLKCTAVVPTLKT